ncbi:MAG: M3 family oligoendopeptidase, partial [Deltaproteobacteria bacterium]|nr:M3 family oligoendopeptidase [Deltaproteobacteria bacterium]
SGKLEFDLAVDGQETRRLPVSMTRTFLEDADPDVRRAALDGGNAAWRGVADVTAACINGIAGTRLELYRRRGIEHFLVPATFDAGITRKTLDSMWDAVQSRAEIARRYLRRKAKLLGCERLGFQDLMAPLPISSQRRVSWDEGRAQILDAFGGRYPALRDFAAETFERRRIDYEPRPGKRPGGFCSTSKLIGESRIFCTYNGALGDVVTVAHELGHAFHSHLLRGERPWASGYPMTLAETASTFAQNLVIDAVIDSPDASDDDRAAMLDGRMQDASTFLLNIHMRFLFEKTVYEERADGELSVDRLCELMLEAQRSAYGDALDPDALDPWFWASKLHFYITGISFYNFPYTFGYLFSTGIFARARQEGPSFLSKYEELLRLTGSHTAEDVARASLGADLEAPDFWNASLDLIEADLERFETAIDARF